MMKDQKKQRRFLRRPSARTVLILIVILVPLIIASTYVDFPATFADIQHFFTPPAHFTYHGHSDYVSGVAWSPNGRYIAKAWNTQVEVWDVATVKNVYTYAGHSADVFAVAWSPDGKRIASADGNGLVLVWDAFTGQHVYTYRGHADYYPAHTISGSNSAVNSIMWSPDGKHIASAGSDTTVQVWLAR